MSPPSLLGFGQLANGECIVTARPNQLNRLALHKFCAERRAPKNLCPRPVYNLAWKMRPIDFAAPRAARGLAKTNAAGGRGPLIIDCHGHYTTAPKALPAWRTRQLAGEDPGALVISDDEIRASIEGAQLKQQQERGADLTLLSPIAGQMGHHLGTPQTSVTWSRACNDLIHRVTTLFPHNFVGVCQLPQSQEGPIEPCLEELRRCVTELGFVGCNLNPDPSGAYWKAPAMTDRYYYPLYEAMVELDVPAMVHVSSSCNPAVHHVGAHYLNGDTTAFMQFLLGDLFRDFPALRLIIPHGGGPCPITGAAIAAWRRILAARCWTTICCTTSTSTPASTISRALTCSPTSSRRRTSCSARR